MVGIFIRIKKVFEFLFYLFYNYFESAGMLARGRKKSFMKAVLVCTDIRLWQSKIYSADALFILRNFLPDFGRGACGYTTARMRKDHRGHSFI